MTVLGDSVVTFDKDMLKTLKSDNPVVDVHAWRGKRLLWAPHPAARIPPGEWVDAVVAAANGGD